MLLNESDLKTLIKDLIKEVSEDRGEDFYGDVSDFPGEEREKTDVDIVLRDALGRINNDIRTLKDMRHGHDPHQYDDIVTAETTFQSRPEVIHPDDEPLVMQHIVDAYKEYTGDTSRDLRLKQKIYRMGGDVLSISDAVKILFSPEM